MASEVQRWKDWYFWWQTKRKATRSGYQWNWIGTWGIKWWWRVMRDFADKFDINVSVPTIHQIITNKILTFKKFVHDGCPDCCPWMKIKGGFRHPATFYDDRRKKVTREPYNHHGWDLVLSFRPGNQTKIGHVVEERVFATEEGQSDKIGWKTHVYHVQGHKRNNIDACRTEWTDC